MLAMWPAALWLWRRGVRRDRRWMRAAAPVLIAGCVALPALLESQSSLAALAVGGATFAVVAGARAVGTRLLAAALGLGTLLAPLLPLSILAPDKVLAWANGLSSTAIHRLYIWRFTAERILERPLLGWGLDSSRVMPGRDAHLVDINPNLPAEVYGHMQVLPLHPHNAPLQVWLELGLPGAAMLAAALAGLLWWLARRVPGRLQAAAAASVLMVALSVSSLSYGIWQTWWLAALWLVAMATAAVLRMPARPRR
jgi:exopolysaccharide production protein ExoQ